MDVNKIRATIPYVKYVVVLVVGIVTGNYDRILPSNTTPPFELPVVETVQELEPHISTIFEELKAIKETLKTLRPQDQPNNTTPTSEQTTGVPLL